MLGMDTDSAPPKKDLRDLNVVLETLVERFLAVYAENGRAIT